MTTNQTLRDRISEILVKHSLRTDRVAIGELCELFSEIAPASAADIKVSDAPCLNQQDHPDTGVRAGQDGGGLSANDLAVRDAALDDTEYHWRTVADVLAEVLDDARSWFVSGSDPDMDWDRRKKEALKLFEEMKK